jgi:hypothetical protein
VYPALQKWRNIPDGFRRTIGWILLVVFGAHFIAPDISAHIIACIPYDVSTLSVSLFISFAIAIFFGRTNLPGIVPEPVERFLLACDLHRICPSQVEMLVAQALIAEYETLALSIFGVTPIIWKSCAGCAPCSWVQKSRGKCCAIRAARIVWTPP